MTLNSFTFSLIALDLLVINFVGIFCKEEFTLSLRFKFVQYILRTFVFKYKKYSLCCINHEPSVQNHAIHQFYQHGLSREVDLAFFARCEKKYITCILCRKDDAVCFSRSVVSILRTTTTRHMVSFIDFYFLSVSSKCPDVNFDPYVLDIQYETRT